MSDIVERLRHWMPIDLEDARWMRNAAADRIEALEAALRKHAWHTSNCRHHGGHDCDCGLDEIRASLAPEQGK